MQDFSLLKSKTITLPLLSVLRLALGNELSGVRELPDTITGEVLDVLVKNTSLFKIQTHEYTGEELPSPVLWSYPEWHSSITNYKKLKLQQEKSIELNAIFKANIKIVKKAIKEEMLIDEDDRAEGLATMFLKKKRLGTIYNILHVKKLITKIEEII